MVLVVGEDVGKSCEEPPFGARRVFIGQADGLPSLKLCGVWLTRTRDAAHALEGIRRVGTRLRR
ncbi:hypothetical protein GCM10010218_12940 [Streptomyces mashuensis]|uniref:Uncharacterized protein n=1 Tax=Streptomyces mashuensis TaxID=33904 RepID=A0A919AYZ6_9ACTN|nr:hypothetical protein GCM10010218_12940 [Streptomyces mashuensis]